MKKPRKYAPTETTLSRRSVIEWLGKATVLGIGGSIGGSIGGGALISCVDPDSDLLGDTDEIYNGNTLGTGPDASTDACDDGVSNVFGPGEGHSTLDDFVVFTVDEQNLQQLIETWTLRVDGLVEYPIELTFKELLALTRQDQTTDFHCVTGWSVEDVPWNGVHLSQLFDVVKPTDQATHVTFHTVGDIYNESLPLDVALEPFTLLGYGVNCSTLPLDHGFPARLVVPRLYGYKNAKYVYRIELDDEPVLGFWEQAGYPYDGVVTERRLREGKY